MRMRIADEEAVQSFHSMGVELTFRNYHNELSNLHYAVVGSDTLPTLFFIHGSPGSWDAFGNFMLDSLLRSRFRIISIDRPGFGYSSFGSVSSLPDQAAIVADLLKKESNGQALHLIGHSIGGPIVVWISQRSHELIASTIVLSGSISPLHEPKERWRIPLDIFPLKYLVPGALRTSNSEILSFKSDLFILDTGYKHILAPLVFIHGDKDPLVTVENAHYGMQKLADFDRASVVILEGANHFIPWNRFELIRDYLYKLEI
jgi:pimeloyl-ACP methyl ester carboxylesterase